MPQLAIFENDPAAEALETHEYFFLISPDAAIKRRVVQYKEVLGGLVPLSEENQKSVPHLTLFKAELKGDNDDAIIEQAKRALKHSGTFNILLDGVEVFQHAQVSRSLVLKIGNPEAVLAIYVSLRKELGLKPKKITPHITIASSIPAAEFDKVDSLSLFDFKGAFSCNGITILKKVTGKDDKYQQFQEIALP